MVGTPGRSGNHDKTSSKTAGEGLEPLMPDCLTPGAESHWENLITLLPLRILSRIDSIELSFLASLLDDADTIRIQINQDPTDLKARRLYLQTFQQVHRLAAVYGLNPADRGRLGFDDAPTTETNPVDVFRESLN